MSNTILVGEKQVAIGTFGVGPLDSSIFNGDNIAAYSRSAGQQFPLTTDPHVDLPVFGSLHSTVVHFGFADGHVQGIPVTTSPAIVEALATPNGGEVIPNY